MLLSPFRTRRRHFGRLVHEVSSALPAAQEDQGKPGSRRILDAAASESDEASAKHRHPDCGRSGHNCGRDRLPPPPDIREVETKSADVVLHLITPDGEAAAGCMFHLSPQFSGGGGAQPWEMSMKTDSSGCATASMCLLEPYVFSIKELGKACGANCATSADGIWASGKIVHVGGVFPLCVEKQSELPLETRNFKGRVVFE